MRGLVLAGGLTLIAILGLACTQVGPTSDTQLQPEASPTVSSVSVSTATPNPTPPPPATPTPTPRPSPSPTPTVRRSDIVDFKLESFTVSVGTTVVWTNRDNDPHTTTSGVPVKIDGVWNSSILSKNDQFSFTFAQPGEFPYWCRVHPDMTGIITVLPPATTHRATPTTTSDFEPGSLRFVFTRGWGSEGSDDGQFVHPTGIAADELGRIYVVDTGNLRVQVFGNTGEFLTKWNIQQGSESESMAPGGAGLSDSAKTIVRKFVYPKLDQSNTGDSFLGGLQSPLRP